MKSEMNFQVKHSNGDTFDMHDLGLWVESFHIYAPNVIRTTQERIKHQGVRLKKSRLGIRKVDISIQIESENMADYDDLKHLIYSIFYTKEAFQITRDITPNKKIYVLQEGDYDISNITPEDGELGLTLSMFEPYIFGDDIDLTIPTAYQTFTIQGQDETHWTSTTTFAAAASQYVIETNQGGKIILNFNFQTYDVLEIDYDKRKVTLNGADISTAISLDTKWFILEHGSIDIKATHQTTLTYAPRYF